MFVIIRIALQVSITCINGIGTCCPRDVCLMLSESEQKNSVEERE